MGPAVSTGSIAQGWVFSRRKQRGPQLNLFHAGTLINVPKAEAEESRCVRVWVCARARACVCKYPHAAWAACG